MPLLFINHKDPDKPRFAAEAFAAAVHGLLSTLADSHSDQLISSDIHHRT